MATIGQKLRRAREAKHLTIDEVTEQTKINQNFIIALETDDYQAFKEEFYIKQYIRTYSRFLGLNSRTLIADIDEDEYEEKGEIHVSQLLFEQKKRATERTQRQFKTMDVLQKTFAIFVIIIILIAIWFVSITLLPKREFQRPGELGETSYQIQEKNVKNLSI
ncbi:MAG: helix-turn-helix domain-containing protein [Culicoidibacterales bacterium]